MASSFMGLYVQREALMTSQKALDIVGNNISNVNTPGYTRQRVDVCSVANQKYNLLYNTHIAMAGQGVETVGVAQYRDALLDTKVRNYTSLSSEYNAKDTIMSDVETALDNIEAEDSGLATNLAKLKEALQSFSSDNADRKEIANVVLQSATAVTQQVRYMNSRLTEISEQIRGDASSTVKDINTILESMGNLNEQITNSYISMGYIHESTVNYVVDGEYGPLELKDRMHELIDQLSEYGNVEVKEEDNGSFTISFAGKIAVHNNRYAQVAMTDNGTPPKADPDPLKMGFKMTDAGVLDTATDQYPGLMNSSDWAKIKIANNSDYTDDYVRNDPNALDISEKTALTTGTLRAYLDAYNGEGIYAQPDGNNYQGIEYYRDMLNGLAKNMTEKLNAIFAGQGAGGSDVSIFTYGADPAASDYENFRTAAEKFQIADDWLNNPSIIAHPSDPYNLEELDNSYVNKMLGVFADSFDDYGYPGHYDSNKLSFEKFVAHITDNLGTQVEGNKKIKDTTDIMLDSVTDARDEVSKVSINEEGINMLNFQKWYNAIARMVTTLDEALDKVVNGMGRVGL